MIIKDCPNCNKDLRQYIEVMANTGHAVTKCPACHFPLALFDQARAELDEFGFEIQKRKTW